MKRLGIAALAIVVLLVAAPIGAQPDESEKADWQDRYRTLIENAALASVRYDAAKRAYSKNRQRNVKRGDKRKEINLTVHDAEIAKAKADEELAEFPELARRAGVPPGWLREVEDSTPPAQITGSDED